MFRPKIIKKRTKARQTLLRNLNKGKARKEARCNFQTIPVPTKFSPQAKIYALCADVVLIEEYDNFFVDMCLYNHIKICKNIQIVPFGGQKLLNISFENKKVPIVDGKELSEMLANADSHRMKQWSEPLRNFIERHDQIIQEFHLNKDQISNERRKWLEDMNTKTERTIQNIKKTYPCIEFRSVLKDGRIELNHITISEKYIAELGYTPESYSSIALQEGLPEVTPIESEAAVSVAKLRIEKYLIIDQDGFSTPVFQTHVMVHGTYMKKVQMRVHYMSSYQNGELGFVFMGCIIAKQKPFISAPKTFEDTKLNQAFVDMMLNKEKEMNKLLSGYYNEKADQKYTNRHKVCQIKEIRG